MLRHAISSGIRFPAEGERCVQRRAVPSVPRLLQTTDARRV